ncbi:MAG: late competence development ComFB family protein [Candidatus Omnitrophica bacterium]|nr:late competence development ComFB family protein [Candidatus Omnitrophota bacterium]
MRLYNYMEEVVKDILEKLLLKKQDICKCQKCKFDMMAHALNRLPPKYVVSNKGIVFTKLQEVEIQFRTDVVKEVTRAIEHISKNPQH